MIIKMSKDKYLSVTKRDTIFKDEYNVNSLVFYIPAVVDDADISRASVKAILELPDDEIIERTLTAEESEYSNYLKYSTVIDSEITVYSGRVNVSVEVSEDNVFLLKSKPTEFFIIESEPICNCQNTKCFNQ